MQPRSLDAILSELNNTYQPQIQSIEARKALIPGQIEAEEKGLQGKQTQAFDDILGGARRRGLGFSGIPLGEQAKYTSTEFLPALARLRQSGREQEMSLQDAILGITERRDTLGRQLFQSEQDRAEQIRQYNESLAEQKRQFDLQQRAAAKAAGGGFSPSYGGGKAASAPQASFTRKANGGFAFTNQKGQSISAAQYAQATGQDIRNVLMQMGQAGDAYAAQLYNQLRDPNTFNDFNKRPDVYKKLYQPIFWGT